jgi:hypothetical protein
MCRSFFVPALLLCALPAFAAAPATPWVSAGLSGATYAMTDVNSDISHVNAAIATSGLSMNDVSHGAGFGFAAGADLGNGFSLGLGYDRLSANSKVADASASIEYDMPANAIRAIARYALESHSRSGAFVELALGRVSAAGNVNVSVTGVGSQTGKIEGAGLDFELGLGGQAWLSPQFGLVGSLGYRHAVAGDVSVAGTPVHNPDGSAYTIDYSGLLVRAGISLGFGK